MNEYLVKTVLLAICAAVCLGYGGYALLTNYNLVANGVAAEAVVTGFDRTSDGNVKPRYQYEVNGQTYEDSASIVSNRTSLTEGDVIAIYYAADDPRTSIINSWWRLGAFPGGFFLLGWLCAFGVGWMVRDRALEKRIARDGQMVTTNEWTIAQTDKKGQFYRITAGFEYNGRRYATRRTPLTEQQSVLLDTGQDIQVMFLPADPTKSIVAVEKTLGL